MKDNLLATGGTLEGILGSVSRFYYGGTFEMKADGSIVRQADGKTMSGVRIIKKAGRYRFEMVDEAPKVTASAPPRTPPTSGLLF